MRALIVVPSMDRDYGGPSAKAKHLASALGIHGVNTQVIGCSATSVRGGVPVLFRFHSNLVPSKFSPFRRAVREADVVHVLGFREPVSALTELLAVAVGKPLVIEPVGTHRPRLRSFRIKGFFDRSLGRLILGCASAVVATSHAEYQDLVADGVPADVIQIRPNGLDVGALSPLPSRTEARAALGVPAEARLILSLGRMIGIKGLHQIPWAMGEMPDDVWALIAGFDERDGTPQRVRDAATEAGVTDRVIIHPRGVWGEEKLRMLAAASACCLPSESESFGNAAAEAAAIGLPVACTDSCGIAEWLDPETSATFTYGDRAGLVRALSKVLQPQVLTEAAEGAERFRSRFGWHSIAEQQKEIYESVLHIGNRT